MYAYRTPIVSPLLPHFRSCEPWASYALGVDLGDVGQSLGEDVARHLVSILVSELGSLALSPLGKCPGICDGSGHDATDGGRDLEDVGDG